jgi:hypothetical protein
VPPALLPRDAVLRDAVPPLPDALAAPLFAAEVRFASAVDDFARVLVALAAPVLALVPLDRDPVDLAAVARDPLLREELERPADALLPPREPPDDEPPLEPSSPVHLPDITRCAASATASAMIDPSFVALDIMLLAAADAVSAASSPASRILRRAAGLALIAAAAAASPAASISLLIAAFASLSIVSLDRDEEPDESLFEDLAIANLPPFGGKDT